MKKIVLLLITWLLLASTSHAYYQAEQGRWLNRDPITEKGGVNVYAFVSNNSISYVDEHGLKYGNPVSGPDGPVYPPDPSEPNPGGGGHNCEAILDDIDDCVADGLACVAKGEAAAVAGCGLFCKGSPAFFTCLGQAQLLVALTCEAEVLGCYAGVFAAYTACTQGW
jgi:hypothetical protein